MNADLSMIDCMRLLSDPTRLRIWQALAQDSLSVVELQEVLGMGQSRISAQLASMKRAGLVEDRRAGKHSYYLRCDGGGTAMLTPLAAAAAAQLPEAAGDADAVAHVLRKRRDEMRRYFNQLAGRFGRDHVPGRSWKALSEMLLKLMPPMIIADLGAGEGTLSQLLAQRASHVIAIDNAEKMVEYGTDLARKHGLDNLEYRLGSIEEIPIEDATVDLALFSQALHHAIDPARALRDAHRILKPGGRVAILDLLNHNDEKTRVHQGDVWPGFSEVELISFLRKAGFHEPEAGVVDRATTPPGLSTILAIAIKP